MKKKLGSGLVLAILTFVVLVGVPPAEADIICESGLGFRGNDGEILDCLEGGGEDCMRCWETIKVPLHQK